MNIAIFTIYFPSDDIETKSHTKAVYYLARKMIETDNVIVVHNRIVNCGLLRYIKREKINKHGNNECLIHNTEGLRVVQNTVFNWMPFYTTLSCRSTCTAVKRIHQAFDSIGFSPDAIVVHFCCEQRQIVRRLMSVFDCLVIPIYHNIDVKHKFFYERNYSKYQFAGARSNRIRSLLIRCGLKEENVFLVNSGVPDTLLSESYRVQRSKNDCIKNASFVFAGSLIECKRVNELIEAFGRLCDQYSFTFTIVGDGKEKERLEKLADDCKISERVTFLGRLTREETINVMRRSDCFIMVSKPETLGIVYLEALACGCIVIGSKGEGIDGIITHGDNGFLAEPGNVDSIVEQIVSVLGLTSAEKRRIIEQAYAICSKYSETAVAREYSSNINNCIREYRDENALNTVTKHNA